MQRSAKALSESSAALLLSRQLSALGCSPSSRNDASSAGLQQTASDCARPSPHHIPFKAFSQTCWKRFSGTDVYAEFTQLQRLLRQYQRNLSQAGQAGSAFTGHLWRRKNASGFEYLHRVDNNEDMRDRLAATEDELINYLETSTMQQLMEALEDLMMLGQRPDTRILSAVVCSLQNNCDAGNASSHDVIEVLGGLAGLGFQPAGPVLDQVCYYLRGRLDGCRSDDISRLMNSMAAFGRLHFPLLKDVAKQATHRCLDSQFSSEALADLFYSFAILGCEAQHMTDAILETLVYDLKNMSPASLSQLVYGLHLLNHRDAVTDVFLDALAEAALLQLHHFSAKQLAILAYNYGTLNHWGRNDQELLDAITIRMLHQHNELLPGQITNLIWAISRASYNSPRTTALLAVLTADLRNKTEHLKPAEVSRLLQSLAGLSFYDESLFKQLEKSILDQLDVLKPEELALIISAFARLMHQGSSVVPAILKSLENRYSDLSANALCALVWGSAVLGQLQADPFRAAVELLTSRSLSEFTARDFMRLYQARLMLQAQVQAEGDTPPKLTEWLHEYAVRSFKDKLYLDRHAGLGQQEICRCLMRMGVTYTLENVVDQILAVDIVLKLPEHPKVAIKMEQVSKYSISRPRRPLADAWISRRLLNARGWNLICISEHEWARLRDFDVKLAFVEDKIKEILTPQLAVDSPGADEPIRQIA